MEVCTDDYHVVTYVVQQPLTGSWFLYCDCLPSGERCGNVSFRDADSAEYWAGPGTVVQPCLGRHV